MRARALALVATGGALLAASLLFGGGSLDGPVAWIGGAVMAAAWAASMQWLALRRKVSFGRWMARGGLGLALGMLAVGVGFVASLLVFPLLWSLAVPLAFALYGALTWRALGCLLRPER